MLDDSIEVIGEVIDIMNGVELIFGDELMGYLGEDLLCNLGRLY